MNLGYYFFLPVVTILYGILIRIFPPRYRNPVYGFKSIRVEEDEKLWKIAQKYYGQWNIKCGVIASIMVAVVLFLPLSESVLKNINLTIGIIGIFTPYLLTIKRMNVTNKKSKK